MLSPMSKASGYCLNRLLINNIEPGSTASIYLPGVHRVALLFKRWMLGTHQRSAGWDHLELYLYEFDFRINRRHFRRSGLVFMRVLERGIDHEQPRPLQVVAHRSGVFKGAAPTRRGAPDRPRWTSWTTPMSRTSTRSRTCDLLDAGLRSEPLMRASSVRTVCFD